MRAPSPANDGMGSLLTGNTCRFRVWVPNAQLVQVVGDFTPAPIDLAPEPGTGNWSADQIPASAGDKYQYIVTNMGGSNNDNSQPWVRTDARALQVQSSAAASMGYIVAPFPAARQPFTTPAFEDFLLYQLHIGSFCGRNDGVAVTSDTATFVDLIGKLDYIRSLGFNAIAPLPITDNFADVHGAGMGYGPCDMFASEELYATSPDQAVAELIQLIDAAHSKGLAVILDVVYNHASTVDNRYWQYDGNFAGDTEIYDGQQITIQGGIYFVHGYHTPWGEGFAVWQQQVLDFLLDNARMYLDQYGVDGLRFDAAQAIPAPQLASIVWTLRQEYPDKYLIAEYNGGDRNTSASGYNDPYGTLGFCATWDLSGPGTTSAWLNGNNVLALLMQQIGSFTNPNQWQTVEYLTGSHDQIYAGNSGSYITQHFGGRTNGWALAKARLAWALNVTLSGTPMLFMGTEGHLDGAWDPSLANGDNRVNWSLMGDPTGAPMQQMVRDANNLRWAHPALRSPGGSIVHADATNQIAAFTRWDSNGDVLLIVVNPSDGQWSASDYAVNMGGETGTWTEIFNSQAPVYGGVNTVGNPGSALPVVDNQIWINLPSWSVLIFQKR